MYKYSLKYASKGYCFQLVCKNQRKALLSKSANNFQRKGKRSDFLFSDNTCFSDKEKVSGFLDYSTSSSLFLLPKLNYWITLHQLHCHLCYHYQGRILPSLCDDYKLFDTTKRVIWGTACEQQHKSVPILYLMVITMKHRKNAKKTWFLTIINFDDNLTAICCVFVK